MNMKTVALIALTGSLAIYGLNQFAKNAPVMAEETPSFFTSLKDAVYGVYKTATTASNSMTDTTAYSDAYQKIALREGTRLQVYQDAGGFLTVGIGHKVTAEDNLVYGQRITAQRSIEFYDRDFGIAFNAAKDQAISLGKYNEPFLAALTSVNFQLGTGWKKKFPQTWAALETGNYLDAINRLNSSLWARQTPVRVSDFTTAIRKAYA